MKTLGFYSLLALGALELSLTTGIHLLLASLTIETLLLLDRSKD